MSNPTLITTGFQKHVRANAPYRANTFTELSETIVGSSARLRGFTFVSENVGVDVTIAAGDFISINHILDASVTTRTSGIIVRTEANTVVDTTGFTNPAIFGFVQDAIEAVANPVEFLVTEAAPGPDIRYAPLIHKNGAVWTNNQAIGNDELGNAGIIASGTDTVPIGVGSTVTITHNLNLATYRILIQSINMVGPVYGVGGLTTPIEASEVWPITIGVNSFDVRSDGSDTVNFDWAVIL